MKSTNIEGLAQVGEILQSLYSDVSNMGINKGIKHVGIEGGFTRQDSQVDAPVSSYLNIELEIGHFASQKDAEEQLPEYFKEIQKFKKLVESESSDEVLKHFKSKAMKGLGIPENLIEHTDMEALNAVARLYISDEIGKLADKLGLPRYMIAEDSRYYREQWADTLFPVNDVGESILGSCTCPSCVSNKKIFREAVSYYLSVSDREFKKNLRDSLPITFLENGFRTTRDRFFYVDKDMIIDRFFYNDDYIVGGFTIRSNPYIVFKDSNNPLNVFLSSEIRGKWGALEPEIRMLRVYIRDILYTGEEWAINIITSMRLPDASNIDENLIYRSIAYMRELKESIKKLYQNNLI